MFQSPNPISALQTTPFIYRFILQPGILPRAIPYMSISGIWGRAPSTSAAFLPGLSQLLRKFPRRALTSKVKTCIYRRIVNDQNYTSSFETMIDVGGTGGGWTPKSMASKQPSLCEKYHRGGEHYLSQLPLLPVVLTSEYSQGSFTNIDRNPVPPNTVVLA